MGWLRGQRKRSVWALCAASVGSALLLRLSFPVPGWFPLAWVALVPWLVVLRHGGLWTRLLSGALTGLTFGWLAVSWQFIVTIIGGTLLGGYIGFYFVLFGLLVRPAVERLRVPFVVAVPALWVGLEYLRGVLFSGFPWAFVAHSQQPFLAIIQVSDLFGALAVSFVVMAANAFAAELVLARGRLDRRVAAGGIFAIALFGATLAYGLVRLNGIERREGPVVGTVQSNVPQHIKNELTLQTIAEILATHLRLTDELLRSAGEERPDLIVWPESMIQWSLNREDLVPRTEFAEVLAEEARKAGVRLPRGAPADLRPLLRRTASDVGCPILVGAHAEIGDDLEVVAQADGPVTRVTDTEIVAGNWRYFLPPTAPEGEHPYIRDIHVEVGQHVKAGDTLAEFESVVHNTAYLFRPDAPAAAPLKREDRYDKTHLVPFGEFVPLGDLLWFVKHMVPFGKGFTPGDRLNLMELDGVRFGVLICFEDAFADIVRGYVVRPGGEPGADFLVNTSNDGWFYGAHELDQHLALSVFRACEFRIGVVRSVNTGISAIIDTAGRVERIVENARGRRKMVEGTVVGRVSLRTGTTLYARIGDVLGYATCGFAALALLAALWRRRRTA
jgi:apolipoprotein N-acyltransferase